MEKVIIIGSGPAGYTAAIYAARANLEPLCIEGPEPGGQLMITSEVENFPGFPEGLQGPDLMVRMRQQAERFGARFAQEWVEDLSLSHRPFTIWSDKNEYKAASLIIASGASARWLGLESEQKLRGRGVSACATCDGFFFRDKEVAVIGGGDSALEEALFLTRFCKKVTIIHRRDELRASKIMQDRARRNPKISFIWNCVIEDILDVSQNKVTGLALHDTVTGTRSVFPCEGVFLAIGHQPNTDFLKGQVRMDRGFIICRGDTTATSVEGVFACGDVADPRYKQAITAAGSGCQAAIDAERFLEAQE